MATQTICDICGSPIKYSGNKLHGSLEADFIGLQINITTAMGDRIVVCRGCNRNSRVQNAFRQNFRTIISDLQKRAGQEPYFHENVH